MVELEQTRHLREMYRNHAVGCPDPYDHPGSCRDPYNARQTQYYSRMAYQASDRHAFRPIHIHQPDDQQPYSANWLFYCGRAVNHFRLITSERQFAARDWQDIPFCEGCKARAPEDAKSY